MATEINEYLHFSVCLPRNDFCTAEPQTIIYSSSHRQTVHDAKSADLKKNDPSRELAPLTATPSFPPSKRSLAPMTEVQEFVQRFSRYAHCAAEFQSTNPKPNRPTSSAGQGNNDDERLTRTSYNVYLQAPRPLIQRGRGDVLQHLRLHHQTFLSASHDLLLNKDNVLPPAYADEFDKIAIECQVEIIIALPSNQNFTIFSNRKKNTLRRGYLGSSEELKEGSKDVVIVLNGSLPSLESGRIKLRVLLDRMQGRVCEVLEGIAHKSHPLLAGRRCYELEENIEKAFNVKIYMHAPTVKVFVDEKNLDRGYDRIYVTGAPADVQKAVAALQARVATFLTMSKDVVLHGSKIDWIITEKLEKLREIMDEDATFINLPQLGAESTVITVSGTTLPLIERSIRRMNKLISDYFQFTYIILPDTNTTLEPPIALATLAWYTGAEVNYSGNCFEISGTDNSIRILLDLLLKHEVQFFPQYPYRVRIRCEMANELQEFVAGKKSGKVNKIMKNTNCNIAFETYTEYNFLIDVMAPRLEEIQDGFAQLLEEFPAELYWYVPEEYHKRIIGVQGKTIQRIMKHYSVYVKFFNALEFAAAGGDSKTEDNVLARTPAKNQESLDNCKKAVLEMVFQNDRDYITETVDIPRAYHSLLQKQCATQLQDIGKNSGATIRFPEPNSGVEGVAITAAPTRIKDVAKALLNLVPMTYTLVGDDPKLASIVESSDFHYSITDQLKVVYRVELTVKESVVDNVRVGTTFHFQYMRPNYEKLKEAVGEVARYVTSKGANLDVVMPAPPPEPETKPFDAEAKGNLYGQGSVTQPYHSPAQVALAAQGSLPPFHTGQHFHQQNGMYHGQQMGGHVNGYGHSQQHYGGRGGYQNQMGGPQPPNLGIGYGNRGGGMMNGGPPQRHMQHHGGGGAGMYPQQGGYQQHQQFQGNRGGGGGGGGSHMGHMGHFNHQYNQGNGMNNSYSQRPPQQNRFMHGPPTPTDTNPNAFNPIPRSQGLGSPSPLDTLGSLELPDVPPPPPPPGAVGSGAPFRPSSHADTGHTPNGGPYNTPPSQSYFPPQQQGGSGHLNNPFYQPQGGRFQG